MEYIYISVVYVNTIMLIFSFSIVGSAPKKIRNLSRVGVLLLSIRYIALVICTLYDNMILIYKLRYIYYFNFISIPIIILITCYIVFRNNKIKFYRLMILSLIYMVGTLLIIVKLSDDISMEIFSNDIMGYRFLLHYRFLDIMYVIINLSSLIFVLVLLNNSYKRISRVPIIASSMVSVAEVILRLMRIDIFPQYIFGELLWVLTFIYIIKKLKKLSISNGY